MRAEVVAVGTEILLGDNVDTNSAWISSRLAEAGIDVFRHVTVGDNLERLVAALGEATARADAVLVTGGLGPTQDDLTRDAVAALAGVPLERDERLVEHVTGYFARSGRDMPARNLVQADLPAGATVITPVGTAAGFALAVGSATVYCLPGVPREMEAMFDAEVLPALVARAGLGVTLSRVVRTAGTSESAVADACAPVVERLERQGGPTVAFLASAGQTRVRVTAKAPSRDEAAAVLAPVVDEVVERLGIAVVGLDDEDLQHAVARQLLDAGWTLAVAESITGGGVGARLVTVPGASAWFRGGIVAYATGVKRELAGVEAELLAEHGPVSEPVAAALASAARDRCGADVGLACVGVAGPAEQGGRPVGRVCVAVSLPDGTVRTRAVTLPGRGRSELQGFAVSVALEYLRRTLARLR